MKGQSPSPCKDQGENLQGKRFCDSKLFDNDIKYTLWGITLFMLQLLDRHFSVSV